MNICICGGGNLGHVVSGYLGAKSDVNVGILTRHPERWARQLEITLPDGSSVNGKLAVVGAPDKPCGVGRADATPKLLLNDT